MTVPATTPSSASLGQVERHIFLRGVLSGVDVGPAAAQMLAAIEEVFFPAGTAIYREGESADHMYFVVEGMVRLSRGEEQPWMMGPRSVFGVLDGALAQPHARTATAVEDVHALVMSVEDWLDIQEDHFELAQAVVLRNAAGLYEMSLRLAPSGGFDDPPAARVHSMPPPSSATPDSLDAVERLVVFSESPLFERAGIQPLINLAHRAEARRLAASEVLFRFGEPVTHLYLVARGEIEIVREEPTLRARFGPGALVGGPGALANEERAFTARAVADAVVLTLRRDDLFDVMEDHFAALRSVIAYLAVERDRMQRLEAALEADGA